MSLSGKLMWPLATAYQRCRMNTIWSRTQLLTRSNSACHPSLIVRGMAGHSKWANIRHTKAAKDAEKQKIFTKCSRLIKLAIKEGGGTDRKLNHKLAKVIEYARSCNMPLASIETAIKASQKSHDDAKPALMEYRGPGGVFILTELLTSNISRTRQTLQGILKKHNVQEVKGSARHMFEEKGIIIADAEGALLETAMDNAIEVGAEDVEEAGNGLMFTSTPEDFLSVRESLESLKYNITYASVDFIPVAPVTLSETDQEALNVIIQKMEEMDDVMKVHVSL